MISGNGTSQRAVRTIADRPHFYGLAPIEQLRGEVTIADSQAALAHVGPEGAVR
jgi:hypothetical protein